MRELTEVKSLDRYNWDELFNGSVWEITKEDIHSYKYLIDWISYARVVAKNKYQMKLTIRTQEKDIGGEPKVIWMKATRN
jgi:hypothetical protein